MKINCVPNKYWRYLLLINFIKQDCSVYNVIYKISTEILYGLLSFLHKFSAKHKTYWIKNEKFIHVLQQYSNEQQRIIFKIHEIFMVL
jgi:hypothetical protein